MGIVDEVYLMIARFLKTGPCSEAADVLTRQMERTPGLIASRHDWTGAAHPRSFSEAEQEEEVAPDHLVRLLSQLVNTTNAAIPPPAPGLNTLLGRGASSMFRKPSASGLSSAARLQVPGELAAFHRAHHRTSSFLQGDLLRGLQTQGVGSPFSSCRPTIAGSLNRMKLRAAIVGHLAPVFCVAFDVTGERFITGSDDKLIKIWSTKACLLVNTLRGHTGFVVDLNVSSDNKMLASAAQDRNVRVWCLETGALLLNLNVNGKAATSVAFSPACHLESRLLMASWSDGTVRFWALSVTERDNTAVSMVATSSAAASSAALASAPMPESPVTVRRRGRPPLSSRLSAAPPPTAGNATLFSQFEGAAAAAAPAEESVSAAAAIPNPNQHEPSILPADPQQQQQQQLQLQLQQHQQQVQQQLQQQQQPLAASCDSPIEVTVRETALLETRTSIRDSVNCSAFSPGGAFLVAVGSDCIVRVIECVPVLRMLEFPDVHTSPITSCVWSPSALRFITTGKAGQAFVWTRSKDSWVPRALDMTHAVVPAFTCGLDTLSGTLDAHAAPSSSSSAVTVVDEDEIVHVHDDGEPAAESSAVNANPNASQPPPIHLESEDSEDEGERRMEKARSRARRLLKEANSFPHSQTPPYDASVREVLMACFTCDNMLLVTAESESRSPPVLLKVWDALTGELLCVLRGHTESVMCLEAHPTHPRVFLSSSHDGHLILWDLQKGLPMRVFSNVVDNGVRASEFFDARFSPDGTTVVVCDGYGRVSIFGTDPVADPERVPSEQFFSNDYGALVRNEAGAYVDELTLLPPHRCARTGLLTNMQNGPHPPAMQADPSYRDIIVPVLDPVALARAVQDCRAMLNHELEMARQPLTRVASTMADRAASPATFTNSPVRRDNQPKRPRARPPAASARSTAAETIHAPDDGLSESSQSDAGDQDDDDDDELDGTYDVSPAEQRRAERHERRRLRRLAGIAHATAASGSRSTRRAARGDGDDGGRSSRGRSRSSRGNGFVASDDEEDEASDSEDEEDEEANPSFDDSSSDSEIDLSDSSESSEAEASSSKPSHSKASAAAPRKQQAPGKAAASLVGYAHPSRIWREPKAYNGLWKQVQAIASAPKFNVQQYLPGPWLTQTQPSLSPYVPQLDDELVYLRAGHEEYVREGSKFHTPGTTNINPWQRYPGLTGAVFCRVLSVEYLVGPPAVCHLKLGVYENQSWSFAQQLEYLNAFYRLRQFGDLSISAHVADGPATLRAKQALRGASPLDDRGMALVGLEALDSRGFAPYLHRAETKFQISFAFRYADLDEVADFLVLRSRFLQSVANLPPVGGQVVCSYGEEWFSGSVSDIDPNALPVSGGAGPGFNPWNGLSIRFDNSDEPDTLSPWDLYPADPTAIHENPLDPSGRTVMVDQRVWQWPEAICQLEVQRIVAGLNLVCFFDWVEPFVEAVDWNLYPDYYVMIQYPMYLSLIRKRLISGWYRSKDALIWDVQMLMINATTYNPDKSLLFKYATVLFAGLVEFIVTPGLGVPNLAVEMDFDRAAANAGPLVVSLGKIRPELNYQRKPKGPAASAAKSKPPARSARRPVDSDDDDDDDDDEDVSVDDDSDSDDSTARRSKSKARSGSHGKASSSAGKASKKSKGAVVPKRGRGRPPKPKYTYSDDDEEEEAAGDDDEDDEDGDMAGMDDGDTYDGFAEDDNDEAESGGGAAATAASSASSSARRKRPAVASSDDDDSEFDGDEDSHPNKRLRVAD
ncbi:hypothetical protein CAOG_004794 [Capsaspora owczarzaki ATCC 30864]|uniref:Bromo domain-containing protein n=1 Tax=Capsaspora owczarzaki (strain ATCC 30864) TaxID=595528 RepID=A0A0D2X3D2_CAPO3|nr:hypothetical protein CAOG_004794 [Capsaspora owczarzaki ATCC 30864]